ncbi:MAG: carboxypeptidase regulatory-like domain-containing protein [Acidobacteria bacterium]|nr:carboxypeptidase regulatory-like domain-containing protein [Acidobacteriota bacterium]
MKRLLTIVLVCLFFSPWVFAIDWRLHPAMATALTFGYRQNGSVVGAVSDPTGAAIVAARVRLRSLAGDPIAETQSDTAGRFAFARVPPGTYQIVVDAAGFVQSETPTVTVTSEGKASVAVRLNVAPISDKIEVAAINPIYQKLRTAKLSGEFAAVNNLVIKRDTAIITFKTGQLFFLAPVEGKVTAAVFLGEGQFQMTPLVDIEGKNLSHYTGKTSFEDSFNKMVIRFTDQTYEEMKKQVSVQSAPLNSDAQGFFEHHRRMLRKGKTGLFSLAATLLRYNLDARICMDLMWQGGQGGLFNAYFDAKHYGDMLYGIDPLGAPFVNPEEVVLANFNETSTGIWVASHIADHYQSPAVFDETHALIDFSHHQIDATMKGKRLDATDKAQFKARVDGAQVLPFELFGKLRVKKIADEQGRELRFIQEDKDEDADLYVILAEPLKQAKDYALTFEYGGDDAVMDSGGGNYTLVTRSSWYPNSGFGEDRATYEMTLRTAKDLTMVATGQLVSETVEGDKAVTKWKSDVPLAVAGFNYGNFKKSIVQDDKTKYTLETYANRDIPDYLKDIQRQVEQLQAAGMAVPVTLGSLNTTSMMEKARSEAQISMQIYTDMFGALPYGRLALTQQPYANFGQAWPMLVYMPLTAFLDSTFRHQLGLDRATNFFKIVAAHEVAHQWWGHIIGWKSYRDQWMSEGFAEFSASIFAQAVYKNDKFLEFWKEEREKILTRNREGKRPCEVGSVYMGYRLDSPKTGRVTQAMIYPKGAFILHMLRMLMWDRTTGDQRFKEMMKDFVKTHFNTNVSTMDFQRIVEKHMTREMDLDSNGKMNWFFSEWVFYTSIPDYKLEYRFEPGEGGKVKLLFKITQSKVDEAFKMRVPIYLDFDGKLTRLGSVTIQGNQTTHEVSVMLPQKPKRVSLCSYEDVLCTTDNR